MGFASINRVSLWIIILNVRFGDSESTDSSSTEAITTEATTHTGLFISGSALLAVYISIPAVLIAAVIFGIIVSTVCRRKVGLAGTDQNSLSTDSGVERFVLDDLSGELYNKQTDTNATIKQTAAKTTEKKRTHRSDFHSRPTAFETLQKDKKTKTPISQSESFQSFGIQDHTYAVCANESEADSRNAYSHVKKTKHGAVDKNQRQAYDNVFTIGETSNRRVTLAIPEDRGHDHYDRVTLRPTKKEPEKQVENKAKTRYTYTEVRKFRESKGEGKFADSPIVVAEYDEEDKSTGEETLSHKSAYTEDQSRF